MGQHYTITFGRDLEVWKHTAQGWVDCDVTRTSDMELSVKPIEPIETALRASPDGFSILLPQTMGNPVTLCWRAASRTAGVVEFTLGRALAARSLVLCGVEKAAEREVLRAFNKQARRWGNVWIRYGEGDPRIYSIKERPLMVTVFHVDKNDHERQLGVGIAQRAFAAAYFRFRFIA